MSIFSPDPVELENKCWNCVRFTGDRYYRWLARNKEERWHVVVGARNQMAMCSHPSHCVLIPSAGCDDFEAIDLIDIDSEPLELCPGCWSWVYHPGTVSFSAECPLCDGSGFILPEKVDFTAKHVRGLNREDATIC